MALKRGNQLLKKKPCSSYLKNILILMCSKICVDAICYQEEEGVLIALLTL